MKKKVLSIHSQRVTAPKIQSVKAKLAVEARKLNRFKAQRLAVTAEGKESVRRKLVVTAEKLRLKAKQLAVTAKEKESVRRKLVVTAEKLKQISVKNTAMLASIGDGFVVVDQAGKIIEMSTAAGGLLGVTPARCMGKHYRTIWLVKNGRGETILPNDRPTHIVLTTGKKVTTTNTTITYFYVRQDGTQFPVAITVTPVILNHKIIGAVDVFRDITKDKEIDRAKSEFISLASHELRTPITIIRWSINMLQKYTGPISEPQKKYVQAIQKTCQEMVDLVDALLNVSRIELGTLLIEPVPTKLNDFVISILHDHQPLLAQKNLHLITFIPSSLPTIRLDPQFVRVAIMNLLTNAIKYTPAEGTITVKVSQRGQRITVAISDTGYGIPPKDQPKIFTKLFRAENILEHEPHGTGLGLYIAKVVVEQSGGKLWFTSTEHRGSTFSFDLPLSGVASRAGTRTITPG